MTTPGTAFRPDFLDTAGPFTSLEGAQAAVDVCRADPLTPTATAILDALGISAQ